ncbi:MAG: GTP 3',8-cyclase MoaA [Acidobacteria bacterium]|nr:GTP 3',8-cyclase MoaA [Acidobacteriota bacterium]
MLFDTMDRPLRDLRISVTDRCNFRCTYCMPREVFGKDYVFLAREELLTFEEIERVVRIFAGLGTKKVRLTGGEPLLRRGIEDLVGRLAVIDGIDDLALTTNGSLLAKKAPALAAAGLDRVTVSLDSLDDTVFRIMSDVDFPVARVLEAIDAAAAAGLTPVKVNAVVQRDINGDQVVDMANAFRGTGHIVRFIEYMDVGTSNGWRMDDVVPAREIVAAINERWPIEPLPGAHPGEVANRWRYLDGAGEIGVIASVTEPFCGDCSRLRLSSEGRMFTCLFATGGTDLRGPLRSGASDDEITELITAMWERREDRYSEERSGIPLGLPKVEMSYIGG